MSFLDWYLDWVFGQSGLMWVGRSKNGHILEDIFIKIYRILLANCNNVMTCRVHIFYHRGLVYVQVV